MGNYLAAVWRCRYFWLALVKMDLATRYRRSVLGLGWSLVHPIALTIIFHVIFAPMFIDGLPHYPLYVLTGLVMWNFITSVTLQGCHCFLLAGSYIRQYPSPLAIFPLRTALGGLVHFLAAMAVVLTTAVFTVGWPNPLALLALVPSILLLFILAWSAALLAGFANVLFRDAEHLTQVAFQMLFYMTPIIYPAQMLENYRVGWLLLCNPFMPFLGLLREPILEGRMPSLQTYTSASVLVLVVSGMAAFVLSRLQRQLVFHL